MPVEFDSRFERDVLAQAVRDPAFRRRASRILATYMFTDDIHKWIWTNMFPRLGPNDAPDEHFLQRYIPALAKKAFPGDAERQEETARRAIKALRTAPDAPVASLAEVTDFAMHQRILSTMQESAEHLKRGEIEEARRCMAKVSRSGMPDYEYTDWWEDWEERQKEREHLAEHPEERKLVPLSFSPTYTKILKGGMAPGEIWLFLATTGRGKSSLVENIAYGAALRGHNVLVLSTEMHHSKVANRLDARWTGRTYDQIALFDHGEEELEAMRAKRESLTRQLKDRIRITSTSVRKCTIELVERMYDDMCDDDMKPDLFVFDSPDHLRPSERTASRRDKESAAYWDVKSLAEEWKIPIACTTHAPKEVVNKIATAENTGESYDKARVADGVVSVNQTKAGERDGTFKFLLAKYRSGQSKIPITVKADLSRILFHEVEEEGEETEVEADSDGD